MKAAEEYISYISALKRYSPRTCEIYSLALSEFEGYCGIDEGDLVGTFTPDAVRNFEVHLMDERRLNPRTVNLYLSVLSGFASFLMRKSVLKSNPVRLVRRPRQGKRLPVFYREDAMSDYFEKTAAVPEYGTYAAALSRLIISLLVNTGIRRSELVSLDVRSLDLARKVLSVKGKGDKMREIPLVDCLIREISLFLQTAEEEFGVAPSPEDPLLRTKKGDRLYPVFVDRVIKKELSQVDGITGQKSPHVLRHTLATELLDGGTDLNSIKEFLGHSSLAATQVYTHNSVEKLKKTYNNAHPRAKSGGKHGD